MKLNKVMALALSGLMAVSMLAGCAGNPDGGDNQGDVDVNPGVSNAVSVMNNMQSRVEFKADTALDTAVAAGVNGLESSVLKNAPSAVTLINSKSNAVYDAVFNKMAGSYKLNNVAINFASTPADPDLEDITKTALYWVKAGNLTEENVLTLVANAMSMGNYTEWGNNGKTGTGLKYYTMDYTGAVSIVKASATSESGDTYSAYVVAVSVTQSFGDETKV